MLYHHLACPLSEERFMSRLGKLNFTDPLKVKPTGIKWNNYIYS